MAIAYIGLRSLSKDIIPWKVTTVQDIVQSNKNIHYWKYTTIELLIYKEFDTNTIEYIGMLMEDK